MHDYSYRDVRSSVRKCAVLSAGRAEFVPSPARQPAWDDETFSGAKFSLTTKPSSIFKRLLHPTRILAVMPEPSTIDFPCLPGRKSYIRKLQTNDLEQCVRVEAAFPEEERCSAEKVSLLP